MGRQERARPGGGVPSLTAAIRPGALFLALFSVFGLAFFALQVSRGGADVISSDGVGYFSHLPSLLLDGDTDYSNQFARLDSEPTTPNHWPLGTALLWAPFYLTGHLVSWIGASLGAAWSIDGTGLPAQYACCLASIAYGAGAVAVSFSVARRWFTDREAAVGALGLFFGGNLVYYLVAEPYMSHAGSAFLSSVMLALLCREEPLGARRGLQFGVLGGLMALVRPQDGLLLMLPFALALLRREKPRDLIVPLLVAGIVSAALFAPQVWLWKVVAMQGHAEAAGSVKLALPPGRASWTAPSWAGALRLTFLWHPVMLVALVGLAVGAGSRRPEQPILGLGALAFLLQLYVVASWGTQGQSFGARMFLVCFPFLALGIATLARWRFRATALLITSLALWNGILMLFYRYHMPDWLEPLLPVAGTY